MYPPHGENALLVVVLVGLGALILGWVVFTLRPSNHPRSIRKHDRDRRLIKRHLD